MNLIQNLEKASQIHNNIKSLLTKDFLTSNTIFDVANFIENEISINLESEKNNGIAFPTGINIDNIVAHYTPSKTTSQVITENNIAKIDYGVHVDGYIIDSAFSVNFDNEYKSICEASEQAVLNVIKNIGVDSRFKELSAIIEETVRSYEFEDNGVLKPVKIIDNVYGHNIKQYQIHGGKFLYPTVQKDDNQIVEENEIMAIEVFTSNGSGKTMLDTNIKNYSHYKLKNEFLDRNIPLFSNKKINNIGDIIKKRFGVLPFCPRYFNDFKVSVYDMQNLFNFKVVDSYPPLLECNSGSKSAQFEHTIVVRESGVIDFNK
jgi:methionyl aminopeptidase